MIHDLKKALKGLLGRDLWIRRERAVPVDFHGSDYGGWAIRRGSVNEDSVVYSFGVGEDASFDLSLIGATGSRVHAFDPTPKSIAWVKEHVPEARFEFHPWALADHDGSLTLWQPRNADHVSASLVQGDGSSGESFEAPCYRLSSIMKKLGHERIDVLKMDIEGAEYGVLDDLAKSGDLSRVGQLLVEFHHWMPSVGFEPTRRALSLLRENGFHVCWVSKVGHEVLFSKV
jgi:FkbM family methyltransferase